MKPTGSLPDLWWSFLKIGAFTFGGGWAMVPLIRKELVDPVSRVTTLPDIPLIALERHVM